MRLLDTLGLVDWPVNRIVLAFKRSVIFRPHAMNDLAGLSEHPHPVTKLGEAIPISSPLVLVPARSDARIQPSMASHVYSRSDLRIQRGVTVAVTADHLPNLDILRVAGEGGCDRPALEASLKFWRGDGMEVVEDPDRVPPSLIGHTCDSRHGLVLLDRVLYLGKVHPPPLRHEDSKSDWHRLPPFPTGCFETHASASAPPTSRLLPPDKICESPRPPLQAHVFVDHLRLTARGT